MNLRRPRWRLAAGQSLLPRPLRRRIWPGLWSLALVWTCWLGTGPLAQPVVAQSAAAQSAVAQQSPAQASPQPSETVAPRQQSLGQSPTPAVLTTPAAKAEALASPQLPLGNKRAVAQPVEEAIATRQSRIKPDIELDKAQASPAEYLPPDFFSTLAQPRDWQGIDLGSAATAAAHRPEIRGVWMTTSDMEILRDRDRLKAALHQLASLNFNTIYPVAWTRGYVTYRSAAAEAVGIPQRARGVQGQDILADLIEQAHREGLSVIPWFEYGLMVPPQSELALGHPDWLTQQRSGQRTNLTSGQAMAWLNPFRPETGQLLSDLALDLVRNYNVDGIQFDDHMSLPRDFGYDDWTRARYRAETGRSLPHRASDRPWVQWRADQLTYLMANLHRAVKAQKPQLILSVSPNRYDFAYPHYLQDWRAWVERGLVDELIVQAYRSDYQDFVADLQQPEIRQARAQIPTGIGILTGLSRRPIAMYQIKQQVRAAQAEGLGVSFFFYESLWDNAPESIAERQSGFRSIFPSAVPRLARL